MTPYRKIEYVTIQPDMADVAKSSLVSYSKMRYNYGLADTG
jgi:hypothetical protein